MKKLGAKVTEVLPECPVCKQWKPLFEPLDNGTYRVACYGCQFKTFEFPNGKHAIGAYKRFVENLKRLENRVGERLQK